MTEALALPRRTVYVRLEEVTGAENNPRSHDSIEAVIGSIRRWGFVDNAVHDGRTDRIIAGHGRKEALQRMAAAGEDPPDGITVDVADGAWRMPVSYGWSSTSDAEAEALLVALNRLTETGGWIKDDLAGMLERLRESEPEAFELTGFTSPQVDEMMADLAGEAYTRLEDPTDLDAVGPVPREARTDVGDLWVIGRHRLAVGDCTDVKVVRRALGPGNEAQMVFTDPPYGVKYEGQAGMKIINDDLAADDLGRLLVAAFKVMHDVLIPGGTFYICSPSGRLESTFRKALDEVDLELRQQIIWVKDRFVLGRSDYHLQHESILFGWQLGDEPPAPPLFEDEHATLLYGWASGAAHTFEGGRAQSTIWIYPKPRSNDLHPTMKPVALCRRAVTNSSKAGEDRGRILDLFGGSGSTMVACETAGRSASLVELDEPYADVILTRMLDQFGLDGVRESDGVAWSVLSA